MLTLFRPFALFAAFRVPNLHDPAITPEIELFDADGFQLLDADGFALVVTA